jgi:hypothetical protein
VYMSDSLPQWAKLRAEYRGHGAATGGSSL